MMKLPGMHSWLLLLLLLLLLAGGAQAVDSPRQPAVEPALTLAGHADGPSLVVQGVLDPDIMQTLLSAFHRRHPTMTIRYIDVSGRPNRVPDKSLQDFQPDLVLSSAMPWQYLHANNGNAMSLGAQTLPTDWPDASRWRNELVGLTAEPLVIVYRREYARRFGIPRSHTALLRQLRQHRDALQGRVVTYDPARSDTGFTYLAEDARQSPQIWSLVAALGEAHTSLTDSTSDMLEGLISGRYLIGYNLIGSYASRAARRHSELKVQRPADYALVMQRLALIPTGAPHPGNARLLLQFLTGRKGQQLIARQTPLGALHPAVATTGDMHTTAGITRFIRPGPGLLALVDPLKRRSLLARWQQAFDADSRTDSGSDPTTSEDSTAP
ncbi:iron(III) transport system substrate-binding protein [Kushneria sinocarnis]|uniref:Iron(III) transport system substrate-binding protein n=1 Tax=Kushneria sinocarnis TaxID=595502 RepID=A0A420WTF8_9GAMM|nr:substrate-binding domain-containing protein [Kushneria sinocarnis]RKQ96382.1 iron(III) transport system substrate-binding protein [Kushneria sinocarnis]